MASGPTGAMAGGIASRCREPVACAHCGTPCDPAEHSQAGNSFCCQGCLTVFDLLRENGLGEFYNLNDQAGVRVGESSGLADLAYLDGADVRARLVDFSDDTVTRVTLRLPAIHCIACVWLLENLHRLKPGIGQSQVNFPRKEVTILFEAWKVKLSEVVALLQSLGYAPELNFGDAEKATAHKVDRKLWLQVGVAGFAFGNIMLLSIAGYFGLDSISGPGLARLTGWLGMGLSIPVLLFSAQDYWRSAWISLRQRRLNIEVPIALGLLAFFGQSAFEFLSGHGEGYFDSLAGLVFFLLVGRVFQQKTYDRLAFDRDYKSFFPLSVTRTSDGHEERVSLGSLKVGDHLLIRNAELIPADARLVNGPALIDYSFVTGESEPATQQAGAQLYAGGRQVGGVIEVEMTKAVSQSHLTSLWNQEAFRKDRELTFQSLTNRFSPWFTVSVIVVALASLVFWLTLAPVLALKSFTAVLIVACPCALALAAPFALGTSQRILARHGVYLKGAEVLESMARVDTVVFDKTGTLTSSSASKVEFHGQPLTEEEELWVYSMTRHSTHPHALRIGERLGGEHFPEQVKSFVETPGCGMEGSVCGRDIWMGSANWLECRNASSSRPGYPGPGSSVHLAIDGHYRGSFTLQHELRPEIQELVNQLTGRCKLVLLSGDQPRERERFQELFGQGVQLHFNQSPMDKLRHIQALQAGGSRVMMVGDGLNDAGALKQSDIGVAVADDVHAFSPASDVILEATRVPQLSRILTYARASVNVVRACLVVSVAYNLAGIAIAAQGLMSPVVCAVLMPISSITVVALASGLAASRASVLNFNREVA